MSRKVMKLFIVMSSVFLFAGAVPKVGDSVELQTWLNARSTEFFRASDKNIERVLAPGTKGQVAKVKHFNSGNYGICLTLNSSENCKWVYYRVRNPNMKLYSRNQQPTRKPEQAATARVIVPTPIVTPIATAAQASRDGKDIAALAVSDIARINANQSRIGSNPASACTDCELNNRVDPVQCTRRNGYLEHELDQEKEKGTLLGQLLNGAIVRPTIKMECVRATQALNSGITYKHCGKNDDSLRWRLTKQKPCQSLDNSMAVYQSINLVAECFRGFDAKTPLEHSIRTEMNTYLMMWESSLQINASSGSSAGGLGQLTADAIGEVNRVNFDQIKQHLARNSNPLCQRLGSEIMAEQMSARKSQSCQRLAISHGSPLRNLVYTFGYQKIVRDFLDRIAWNNPQIERYLSDLSVAEREEFKTSIAIWTHNPGPGGMQVPLMSLLNERARTGAKLKSSEIPDFLAALKVKMVTNPHRANRNRTGETSQFMDKVLGRAATISESAGGSCVH